MEERRNQQEFEIRTARNSDYDKLANLCARAYGPHDHVIGILNQVISEGGCFVAFLGENLVGMTNFAPMIDGSGWLGHARVDPDQRGKGMALILQNSIAEYAKKKSIDTLRLFFPSRNEPSIRAAEKGGFKPIAEAAHMSLSHLKSIAEGEKAVPSRSTRFGSIANSSYLQKTNGFIEYAHCFVMASEKVIDYLSKSDELYASGELSFTLERPDEEAGKSEFFLLSGVPEPLLKSVILTASSLGLDSVGSFFPVDQNVIRAATGLGFKPDAFGEHVIIFEKKIS